jgi:hypothetical protein
MGDFGVFRLMNDPFFNPKLFDKTREGQETKSFLKHFDFIVRYSVM